jgi:hypothetical protein
MASRQCEPGPAFHEVVDRRARAVDVGPPGLELGERLGLAFHAGAEDVAHVDVDQRLRVVVIARHRLARRELALLLVGVLPEIRPVANPPQPSKASMRIRQPSARAAYSGWVCSRSAMRAWSSAALVIAVVRWFEAAVDAATDGAAARGAERLRFATGHMTAHQHRIWNGGNGTMMRAHRAAHNFGDTKRGYWVRRLSASSRSCRASLDGVIPRRFASMMSASCSDASSFSDISDGSTNSRGRPTHAGVGAAALSDPRSPGPP